MKLVPFTVDSAVDAVSQIRDELGPDAVVVNVRRVPAVGLARLWQKPRIEVLAYKPEPDAVNTSTRIQRPGKNLRQEPAAMGPTEKSRLRAASQLYRSHSVRREVTGDAAMESSAPSLATDRDGWRIGSILERSGMLPLYAQQVLEQLKFTYGEKPPSSVAEEIGLARSALTQMWHGASGPLEESMRPHVFVGPPGSGKTTVLCKWLTQSVLLEDKTAHVWRLDGATANASENLSLYCEILGVPVQRTWQMPEAPTADEIHFLDLPGVSWRIPQAIREMGDQLKAYAAPHVHLVLNGAYETSILVQQLKAFSHLPIDDIILTHLDEENRWGKIWNFVLGTNYTIGLISAGQNIPGDFFWATPERVLNHQLNF